MRLNVKQTAYINKYKILEIASFGFFIFMMLFRLTHSALWGDEWVEYTVSQADILSGELYHKIIGTFQPPLYNFLMHFWLKAGLSVLWFRFFNVILGSLSGIFLFRSLTRLYNQKTACVTLCILAVCYQWIYCIQECSEYALMLCALFGAIYFYILSLEKFTYPRMVLFVLFSIAAIYSQYGSVFVVLPLLLSFFIINIFDKTIIRLKKIWLIITYLESFLIFAIPLYVYFLKFQMKGNQISENKISLTPALLTDLPFCFGKIVGYLFNTYSGDIWQITWSMLTLFFMGTSIMLLFRKNPMKASLTKKSLLICTWLGYFAHYLLVQLHIYAMVHPGQSGGFFARYSYFYIPILCITLPIIISEYRFVLGNTDSSLSALHQYMAGILCAAAIGLSFYSVLGNWNKALDNQFAEIWLEHNGWEDVTYLYGCASYGFEYYVSHSEQYKDGFLDNSTTSVDNNSLPPKFWAWRTNWGGDGWQQTIDAAKALGYTVTIYNDSGYAGQLAYCSYSENPQ